MNVELKKKLDERLIKGEITTDEYKKILETIEIGNSISSNNNPSNNENVANFQSKNFKNFNDKKGFFKKLRDGDYGLAKTYWLYGVIVSFIISILIQIILAIMRKNGIILIFIVTLIGDIYYLFFLFPGIWNAANQYQGIKLWSILAKITVIVGIISVIFNTVLWWLSLINNELF